MSAAIGDNGSFEFPKVGPGTYRILLDGKYRLTPSEITVGEDETIIRVEAPFKPWLRGRAVFAVPTLSPEILAAVRVSMSNGVVSAVKPDGSFLLQANDGSYECFVADFPEEYAVKSNLSWRRELA